jgi:hypothetical protein
MNNQEQKRMDKALKHFTPEFIAAIATDPLTSSVFNHIIKGNGYKVIEGLIARIKEQDATIANLVATYGPDYKYLTDTS